MQLRVFVQAHSLGLVLLFTQAACAVQPTPPAAGASGYTQIPELETLLPAEPGMPTTVCITLEAKLRQSDFRLPDSVDADPANSSLDGARLQAAINACPAGQAVKLVASGTNNAFLSGPFAIKSGVTLWIDSGVTLFASRSPRDYDVGNGPDAGYCGTADAHHKNGCNPWITATDTVGSGIVGNGVVDGRGGAVLTSGPHANKITWWDLSIQSKARPALQQNNPRLLQVTGGNHFTLYHITLTNSPKFHVGTNEANDFIAWNVKLVTPSLAYSVPGYACAPGTTPEAGKWKISTCFQPENAKNTDGIDPGNSRNVTVAYSFISTGDDNVAIKAGANPISRALSAHQRYAHNRLYYGHGMSVGSETDTGLQDLKVWDLAIDGQDSTHGIGIRIKSDNSRGGEVKDVLYRNVCIRHVAQPLVFDPYYGNGKDKGLIPHFHDITLQDVHVTSRYAPTDNGGAVVFSGYGGNPIRPTQIALNNVYFDAAPDFQDKPYHDVQFTLGAGTNITPPAAATISVTKVPGTATPLDCPDNVFVKFPSPVSPI
jgi:polygalacturonase